MKARRLVYKIQGALAATSSSSVAGIVVMLLSPRWSLSPQGRLACETAIRYWQLQILDTWTCIRIRHTSIQTCMYVSIYIYIHTRLTDFLHIYRPSRDHSQIPRYKWECLKIRSAPSPQIFIENAMFGALLFWSTSTLFFFNDYTILYYNHTCWNYLHPLKVNTTPKSYPNSTSFRRFWWYSKRRGKDYKTTSSTHPFLQLPNLLQQPCHQQEGIQTTLWEWDLAPTQS